MSDAPVFSIALCCGAERYRNHTGHTAADRKRVIARLNYFEHYDVAEQRTIGVWRWQPVASRDVRRRKVARNSLRLEDGRLVEVRGKVARPTRQSLKRVYFSPCVCPACGEKYPLAEIARDLNGVLDQIREQTPGDHTRRAAYELFRQWVAQYRGGELAPLVEGLEGAAPRGVSVVETVWGRAHG